MSDIQHIDFHGQHILSWRDETSGKVFASLKALCEPLGLNFTSQVERIQGNPLFAAGLLRGAEIRTPGGKQRIHGFDITLIQLWLASINSSRISAEKRALLLLYQRECAQALHAYWTTGSAVHNDILSHGDLLVQMAEAYRAQERRMVVLEQAQQEQQQQVLAQQAALIESQAKAIEALAKATQAEDLAHLALQEVKRQSVEDFIVGNKLLAQFPMSDWDRIGTWMTNWCAMYGEEVIPDPVQGKRWTKENTYPNAAFAAWLRYEQRRPRQLRILPPRQEGA